MRDHLFFYVNGRPVEVRGEDAWLTLSDFLRRRQRLTGTKVVCAEGDCGSCSAFVGRVRGGRIDYAPVTSCIQILFQLDGAHVVTVEGLKYGDRLNPIQQSMVACHGAQCGFCTPGFIISLYDVLRDNKLADAHTLTRGLVGNLCRCTGYDSIVKAALATDRASLKPLDALYPPEPILEALTRAAGEEVRIDAGVKTFYKPVTLDAATQFRAERPTCSVIAGATDLGVVYNKKLREIDEALSLSAIAELRTLGVEPHALHVGAACTLMELEQAANEHLPELGRFLAWFGSPLIKNAGTLGGNLVTGSPIGDTLPPLIALGADIHIAGPNGSQRTVPIADFYTGYRSTVLGPGELVKSVTIPLPAAGEIFKLYKVSRRKDLDISTFSAAIRLRRDAGRIAEVRIAYGGVGPMVLRMAKTEAVLRNGPATIEQFERAAEVAIQEVTPITDVRGSETYRRALAGNILLKFWHETLAGGGDHDGSGNGHAPRQPSSGRREKWSPSPLYSGERGQG